MQLNLRVPIALRAESVGEWTARGWWRSRHLICGFERFRLEKQPLRCPMSPETRSRWVVGAGIRPDLGENRGLRANQVRRRGAARLITAATATSVRAGMAVELASPRRVDRWGRRRLSWADRCPHLSPHTCHRSGTWPIPGTRLGAPITLCP
jgi:hypothetical protein